MAQRSILYRGGRVYTSVGPACTALLTVGGTIAWVGTDGDGPAADTTIDLHGAWVAPAFVDAHVHVTSTGLALTGLNLTDSTSLAQALRFVEDAARRARGGVVLGTGWDETRWPEQRPPTAAELDRASYGGVVYLARTDVHSAVASSALLAAAPEARVLPGFLPDGLVRQAAHHAVRRAALAAVTDLQRRTAQAAALDRAAALGIGCVHECAGPDISGEGDLLALLELEHGVEVIAYWGELAGERGEGIQRARDLGAVGLAGDLFVDGSLGSHTACLLAPYVDDSGNTGHAYLDAAQIGGHVAAATRAGLQAGFHAIGDAALEAVIAGLHLAAAELGEAELRAARHRVEHVEMVSSGQLAVLAYYGVTASVQPGFDARWGGGDGMYAQRLGVERALAMNPLAALAEAGVPLALGSDSPVTPLDPWGTVRAAVGHRTAGSGLTPGEAFAAHTQGGWRAARRDSDGELAPGAPATFAVWEAEGDLLTGVPTCQRTVVRGEEIFSSGS